MENIYDKVDKDWLTKPTGDVFADVGGYTIKFLFKTYPDKTILDLIDWITNVYVHRWEAKINAFFLNHPITQPAYIVDRKIEETGKYYRSIIEGTAGGEMGYCRISGRKTQVFKSGRDFSILSGSGTFINFHSHFQPGIMLSKEMIIRMLFVPFGAIRIGGNIAVVQSNSEKVNELLVESNCAYNDSKVGISSLSGMRKSELSIPSNALFSFVNQICRSALSGIEEENLYPYLTLYHFSNFGASPELTLYKLPSRVFQFYRNCQSGMVIREWQTFLYAHYRSSKYKDLSFIPEDLSYETKNKNGSQTILYDEYKTWRNVILDNLLNGKSLIPYFLSWGRTHRFSNLIVQNYLRLIHNMKKETINKIKELALFLTDGDASEVKKSIRILDGCKSVYGLRRFFLKNIAAKNYNEGGKECMITLENIVYDLFPDDISWRDIRDILLFAVYQELHEKNIRVEIELSEIEPEEINQ